MTPSQKARKEAARTNRLRKMTRYVIRVVWPTGTVEDHAYYGSRREAESNRNRRVRSGNITSGEVLDTWAPGYQTV